MLRSAGIFKKNYLLESKEKSDKEFFHYGIQPRSLAKLQMLIRKITHFETLAKDAIALEKQTAAYRLIIPLFNPKSL